MQPLRHIFDEIVAHESNTPTQPSNRQIYARLAYTPERKSQAHRLPAKGQVARLPRIQNLMNQPTPRSVSRQAGALTTSRLAGRILKTCVVGHSVEAECTACSSCLHRRQWLTHAQARHCCTRSSSRSNVTSPSTADEPQRGIAARRAPPQRCNEIALAHLAAPCLAFPTRSTVPCAVAACARCTSDRF